MVMVCCNLGPGELQFMVRLTTTVACAMRSHGSYSEWSYTVVGHAYASFRAAQTMSHSTGRRGRHDHNCSSGQAY